MSKGTFLVYQRMMEAQLRQFSIGVLVVLSSILFSTCLMASSSSHHHRHCSECACLKGERGPQGDVGPLGTKGADALDGLNAYAAFQYLIPAGTETINYTPPGAPIDFGQLVAGSVGTITDSTNSPISTDGGPTGLGNSMFQLDPGTYLVSAGVSIFGTTTGNVTSPPIDEVLVIMVNGVPLYWPLFTTTIFSNFIELSFIVEVPQDSQPSMLTFSLLPAAIGQQLTAPLPISAAEYLQNYLSIVKIQ